MRKRLTQIQTSNGPNGISVLPVSYRVIIESGDEVCVESKAAECTRKDPCKILAMGAKFLSSCGIYSRVDKSFYYYRNEAKSRPLEARRDIFRCSPCLRFHGFNASRESYLKAGKAAEGAIRSCACT
jgi:hypothetical protein